MASRGWVIIGCVALVATAGLIVAFSDAGLPLPGAVVATALATCLVVVLGAGVVGYSGSRAEGRGFWRSFGSGVRTSLRTVFDLF